MKYWQKQLRYRFWDKAIASMACQILWHGKLGFWPNYGSWNYLKKTMLPDDYAEWLNDAVGCYCMGGEL